MNTSSTPRRYLIFLLSLAAAGAFAAQVDLAQAPLYTTTAASVKPNLMFILDDSGSMDWAYAPDDVPTSTSRYAIYASQCNGMAFNPAITYALPVKFNGDAYPANSYKNTCSDGFIASTCSGTDLSNNYYYTYSGSQAALSYTAGTGSAFYKECNSSVGYSPGKEVFTKVLVSSLSDEQKQNYSNWYTYYRTRMMTMKSGVGLAFKRMNSNFRIGFTTISDTGATDGTKFLTISDFDSTQKSSFYSKLYAIDPSGGTPLRSALAKVGRIYAGQLGTDPVQYSCQQNFALLSTDGYWDTPSTGPNPVRINGSTEVGQQDGSAPRPMSDGAIAGTVTKTPTVTVVTKYTQTDKTTTTEFRRYSYYYGSYGKDSCSGSKHRLYTQEQRMSRTSVDRYLETVEETTTVTRTVVTSNGVVTSDTSSTATTSTVTNSTSSNQSSSDSAWSNYGSVSKGSCTGSTSLPNPNPSVSSQVSSSTASGTPTVLSTSTTGPTVGTPVVTTYSTGGHSNTLADTAYYYYETDLRDSSLNNCTSGSGTNADVCENNVPGTSSDNNPKQHMTTFTLGLGVDGTLAYSPTYQTDTSGDFYQIKTGGKDWPDPTVSKDGTRVDDMWHAAVNGRGVYFSAKNPDSLVNSLTSALAGMSARLGYGTAAATSNLEPILGDNTLFVASYTTALWTGNVQAMSVNPTTGAVNQSASWCVESVEANTTLGVAACTGRLAAQVGSTSDSRNIYFKNGTSLTSFTYDNLDSTKQAWFNPDKLNQWSTSFTAADKAAATGATLVNFLRGRTQYENQASNSVKLYRDRSATLGDIVDSQPVYVKGVNTSYSDPGHSAFVTSQSTTAPSVYIGSNDGMLHSFNAETGDERWAYVPTPVMPKMFWLADYNYTTNHRFMVNGKVSVMTVCVAHCSDVDPTTKLSTAEWRRILVGGLNGGGRGYYALDVTDPTAPRTLWEFTSLDDADLGYSFGNPLAVKKSDGTWVILVTSGYNNVSQSNGDPYDAAGTGLGYLYVLNPLTGAVISKISTGTGSTSTPSGLGRISAWADNPASDATIKYVYGGDLLGNLWRFDINAETAVRLATFTDASNNVQPITTRPELAEVDTHRVVYVATGKYLEGADLTSSQVQTLYAIKDVDAVTALDAPRDALVKQTLANDGSSRTLTSNAVDFATGSGWYVDFPDTGERTNVDPSLVLGTLLVATNVPTNGVCEAGGYSWLNYFNYKNGSYVPGATAAGTRLGNDMTTGINVVWINGKPVPLRTGNYSPPAPVGNIPIGDYSLRAHRVNWREVVKE
ncbi:MAG: pilus assembly protein [Pseudomonadota bacterium]|jgi:type IV pilus assembly protein PilY1